MSLKRLSVTAAVVALVLTACGRNNENNGPVPNNTPNNGTANNDTDAGNNGTANNDTDAGNNGTVNNTNNIPGNCAVDEEFTDEATITIEREFRAPDDTTGLGCANDVGEIATNGSYIVKLQYSFPTHVEIRVAPVLGDDGSRPPRPGLEVRRLACETGDILVCGTDNVYSLDLDANTAYYLVFAGLLESNGLNLTINAESEVCTAGEMSCADGTVGICNSEGTSVDMTTCPADCDGDRCMGDVCESAIVVTPQLNGPAVDVVGDRRAFTGTWDAMSGAGCKGLTGETTDSPGRELFLRVQGAQAGQRVQIISDDTTSGGYNFLVLDSCGATTCLDGFFFDPNGVNRMNYTVPADGDVLVAVEAMPDDDDDSHPFIFHVTLLE